MSTRCTLATIPSTSCRDSRGEGGRVAKTGESRGGRLFATGSTLRSLKHRCGWDTTRLINWDEEKSGKIIEPWLNNQREIIIFRFDFKEKKLLPIKLLKRFPFNITSRINFLLNWNGSSPLHGVIEINRINPREIFTQISLFTRETHFLEIVFRFLEIWRVDNRCIGRRVRRARRGEGRKKRGLKIERERKRKGGSRLRASAESGGISGPRGREAPSGRWRWAWGDGKKGKRDRGKTAFDRERGEGWPHGGDVNAPVMYRIDAAAAPPPPLLLLLLLLPSRLLRDLKTFSGWSADELRPSVLFLSSWISFLWICGFENFFSREFLRKRKREGKDHW